MPVGSVSKTISLDGDTFPPGASATYISAGSGVVKQVIGPNSGDIAFSAGLAGSSTENTSGGAVITLAIGHGLTTADKVGVFWAGGYRIGMTVSAYTTNSITVTVATGSGTTFVTGTATVVVSTPVVLQTIAFDGDNMSQIAVYCDQIAVVQFLDSGNSSVFSSGGASECYLATAGIPFDWIVSDPTEVLPITGNPVASANCYNGSLVDANLIIKVLLYT
jgi:hypothetical protein